MDTSKTHLVIRIAPLRSAGETWDAKRCACGICGCGLHCPCKIAQQSIRQCCVDISMEYALETLAAVILRLDTPSTCVDKPVIRLRFAFATSDWLDRGHLATLVITAKKRWTAVSLQRLGIVNSSSFNLVNWRLGQYAMMISSAQSAPVVPLTTQTLSEEREEHTKNLDPRDQVDPDRNKYPIPSLQHRGNGKNSSSGIIL